MELYAVDVVMLVAQRHNLSLVAHGGDLKAVLPSLTITAPTKGLGDVRPRPFLARLMARAIICSSKS